MNNEFVDTLSRREQIIYLAGVMDSDGCAQISKIKEYRSLIGFHYRSVLRVGMSDIGPVQLFYETFGGSLCYEQLKPPYKSRYNWTVAGKRAAEVALQLIPFSHNDRKRAALQCIVAFGKTILPHNHAPGGVAFDIQRVREKLHNRCRALNTTGSEANNQSAADLEAIKAMKLETAQLNLWNE